MNIHLAQWEWENTLFFLPQISRCGFVTQRVFICVCISCFCSFFLFYFPECRSFARHSRRAWLARAESHLAILFSFLSLSLSFFRFNLAFFDRLHFRKKKGRAPSSEIIAGTAVPSVPLPSCLARNSFIPFFCFSFFLSMRRVCCKKRWILQRAIQLFTARDHVDSISA